MCLLAQQVLFDFSSHVSVTIEPHEVHAHVIHKFFRNKANQIMYIYVLFYLNPIFIFVSVIFHGPPVQPNSSTHMLL